MSETIRKIQKARLAGLIARDFEKLARARPDARLEPAFTWEGIERLAKRLELMPDTLATMLVNESITCDVTQTPDVATETTAGKARSGAA